MGLTYARPCYKRPGLAGLSLWDFSTADDAFTMAMATCS